MKIFNFLDTKNANPCLHFAHRLPLHVDSSTSLGFLIFLTTSKVIFHYLGGADPYTPAPAEQILSWKSLTSYTPRMLILGFILPTAFLSMWISNTATTAMMVPILEAVIAELESAEETDLGGDTTIEDTMGLNRFWRCILG